MKCRWIKLTNFIGIKNGMNLDTLEIDFSKGNNNLVVIMGDNGSGKSTTFNAINILPDSYSDLIPQKVASKEGIWEDKDVIYHIKIVYGFIGNPENNKRETKAYIKKMIYGMKPEEMNPNGNVTSYKDFIFNEFNLDSNFMALSQISSEKRGIVDKNPSERKKYVGSVLSKLEVYNNIHKTISKRSATFKGVMNSITSKLNNIGDINKLKMSIDSIESRINKLENDKKMNEEKLSEARATIKLLDPDGSIQQRYIDIANAVASLDSQNRENEDKISLILQKINLNESDDIEGKYNELKALISDAESSINYTEALISSELISREEDAKAIQIKTDKLNLLKTDDTDNIESAIKNSEDKIHSYESIYNKMDLPVDSLLTKDEYITGINTLRSIKDSIDAFKGSSNYFNLVEALEYYRNNQYPDIDRISDTIDFLNERIKELEKKYQEFTVLKAVSSKISQRPSSCRDDTCPFIKDAVEALSFKPEENLIGIQNELNDCKQTLEENASNKAKCESIISSINFIKSLERSVTDYRSIINKLPNGHKFTNRDELIQRISNGDSFKEIDELYNYIQYANVIELYHQEKETLHKLKSNYEILKNKNVIIDELIEDINSLNIKLDSLNNSIKEKQQKIAEGKSNLIAYKDTLSKYELLMEYLHTRYEIKQSKSNYILEFNQIRSNMEKIRSSVNDLNTFDNSSSAIDNELVPLRNELEKLRYNMKMYVDYSNELEEYKSKYDKIETIKKYSSPTQGIQLQFIDMYMGQTIQLTNHLLSKLFGGNLTLSNYVINESEFRIPCIGENLPVDDISSLSTSQKCMVTMILSFALLKQSSPKYDILKLDEIDGGLDTYNRRNFLPILEYMMEEIGVEQCILISHNSEIDYSKCDLVVLKHDGVEIPSNANIIYQY